MYSMEEPSILDLKATSNEIGNEIDIEHGIAFSEPIEDRVICHPIENIVICHGSVGNINNIESQPSLSSHVMAGNQAISHVATSERGTKCNIQSPSVLLNQDIPPIERPKNEQINPLAQVIRSDDNDLYIENVASPQDRKSVLNELTESEQSNAVPLVVNSDRNSLCQESATSVRAVRRGSCRSRTRRLSFKPCLTQTMRSNSAYFQEIERRDLTRDTYSMLFLSPVGGKIFWLCIGVFLLKVLIYILLTIELMRVKVECASTNCHDILEHASLEYKLTIATTFLALPISVFMQSDVLETYYLACNISYSQSILHYHEFATHLKYIVANCLRFIDGVLSLFINLLVLYDNKTILSLLLNFAALQFLQAVDNIIFEACEDGHFGITFLVYAKAVTDTKFNKYKEDYWNKIDSYLILFTVCLGYVGWIIHYLFMSGYIS